MGTKLVLNITADDVTNGIQGSNCDCPVALCVKRTLGIPRVSVGNYFFDFVTNDGLFDYRMSPELVDQIKNFDATGNFVTGEYTAFLWSAPHKP